MTIIHETVDKVHTAERSLTKVVAFSISIVTFLLLHIVTFALLFCLVAVTIPLQLHPKTRPLHQELLLELEAYL